MNERNREIYLVPLTPDEVRANALRRNDEDDPSRKLSDLGADKFIRWAKSAYVFSRREGVTENDAMNADNLREHFSDSPDGFQLWDVESEDLIALVLNNIWDARRHPQHTHCLMTRRRGALKIVAGQQSGPAPRVDWLIDGLIPRGAVGGFVAEASALKSLALFAAVKACAYSQPFLGRRTAHPEEKLSCVWLDYEMGETESERRRRLLGDHEGRIKIASHPAYGIHDDALWTDELPLLRPDVVVIDSYSAANRGARDERDSRYADALVGRAAPYAQEHGTTFIVLCHSPKLTGTETLAEIFRGSSAIPGSA